MRARVTMNCSQQYVKSLFYAVAAQRDYRMGVIEECCVGTSALANSEARLAKARGDPESRSEEEVA